MLCRWLLILGLVSLSACWLVEVQQCVDEIPESFGAACQSADDCVEFSCLRYRPDSEDTICSQPCRDHPDCPPSSYCDHDVCQAVICEG